MTEKGIIKFMKNLLLDFAHPSRTAAIFAIGGINELLMMWFDDFLPMSEDIRSKEIGKHINEFTAFLDERFHLLEGQDDLVLLKSSVWKEVQKYAAEILRKIEKETATEGE